MCVFFITMLMGLLPCNLFAQTLQGTVTDAISGEPLTGAAVYIVGLQKGSTVDSVGDYSIRDIPVGRYTIECRQLGYETQQQVEVQINSNHATVVDFRLMVMPKMLEGVTITVQVNKARALNPTAVAGTKMISVDEAKRYGGAFDDIARVVKHNVGTTGSEDNTSLSVHGNPTYTTVFRIDGVEMPSPNHFDGTGDFGTGKISALHTDLLANSDFYTAAPVAEIGNSLGGVMDLNLRSGNKKEYEHSARLSILGLDVTSEGPINRVSGSSYIFSYRYGLTKLANDMGVSILEGDQADYQDLYFKLNYPVGKRGTISVWGLGLWDHGYMLVEGVDQDDWEGSLYDQEDWYDKISTLMGGVTYDQPFGDGWRLRANLAAANRRYQARDGYYMFSLSGDTLNVYNRQHLAWGPATPYASMDNETLWLTAAAALQKRFSDNYLQKTGFQVRSISYSQSLKRAANIYSGFLIPLAEGNAWGWQLDLYGDNNFRYDHWTFNAGLHVQGWTLANDYDLQPRLSAEWRPASGHTFSVGLGRTSRIENMETLLAATGNLELKMVRSNQAVLGYKWQPRNELCFNIEAWGEYLTNVPVSPTGTYCIFNRRLFYTTEPLVSEGHGRNLGIGFNIEHYMTKGYYFQVNASIFKSEYRAIDKVWRHTLYDRGWAVNAVGGKEWVLGNKRTLSVNIAGTMMGGLRATPFDEDASAANFAAGNPYCAYQEDKAMSLKTGTVYDLSFNINYRIKAKKVSHVIGLDYMNVLANEEPFQDFYNYVTNKPMTVMTCYSIPNFSYTIEF